MPDAVVAPGTLILVVGPSGAGKDTLIAHAAQAFTDRNLIVARRIVTRPASPAEDHDVLDGAAFAAAAAQGRFAVRWRAHGLDYAIPTSVDAALAAGRSVLCNVSRAVVPALRDRSPRVAVVYVDAPLAVRQRRVAARRRSGESAARTERHGDFTPAQADHVVDNGGTLEAGRARFAAVVAAILDGVTTRRASPET